MPSLRQEAQAIVLAAGPGMRMTTLTNLTTKCLLPIGTLPMIYYPLLMLQEAGFSEVTVVVSSGQEGNISKVVEQYGLKLSLDIATVKTSDDPGTADSLRHIKQKIKRTVDEVLLVSSDLITDAPLHALLDQHRAQGSSLTMLTADNDPTFTKAATPGPKNKHLINPDVLCTDESTGRLVFSVAGGDYDEDITLGSRVLSQSPSLTVSAATQDAHLYVIKRWLLDYLLCEESACGDMGSLKAEILPHIVSRQYHRKPTSDKSVRKPDIHDFIESDDYEDLILKYNTSTVTSRFNPASGLDARVCHVFQHPGICVRANTLPALWQLNKKMHELFPAVAAGSSWAVRHSSADIQPRAQVSEDSMIGAGTVISEKTNVSSSVIGNHCRVQQFCRVSGSVLTDHVTLAQGCVVDNSLIAANIEKKCTLKNCIVTSSALIKENQTYMNEVLEASHDFAE